MVRGRDDKVLSDREKDRGNDQRPDKARAIKIRCGEHGRDRAAPERAAVRQFGMIACGSAALVCAGDTEGIAKCIEHRRAGHSAGRPARKERLGEKDKGRDEHDCKVRFAQA